MCVYVYVCVHTHTHTHAHSYTHIQGERERDREGEKDGESKRFFVSNFEGNDQLTAKHPAFDTTEAYHA